MKKKHIILLTTVNIILIILLCSVGFYAWYRHNAKQREEHFPDTADQTADNGIADKDSIPDSSVNTDPAVDPKPSASPAPTPRQTPVILDFAGDVNLDDSLPPAQKYDSEKKGILGAFSKDLVDEMNAADIMMLNNEFAYSTSGTKTPNKSFTFRAHPSRVNLLKEMGVDIVSLANNHALDFGQEALLDTFDTLTDADIDYIGAGKDLDRAKAPMYYSVGDKKIAYIAASRVVFDMSWYATDTQPGMVGTYDPAPVLETIEEAAANSDFVVIFVHWGVERANYPVDYQRTLAKLYIDAGADLVVGCHPHVMQGFEFYKGKPIAYSLGNYWFNAKEQKSGLLKLYLHPDDSVQLQILPVMSDGAYNYILEKEADRKSYFDFMEELSFDAAIDGEGFITEVQE